MTARRFLTQAEAAQLLRLSERTLEGLRVRGGGPRYRKFLKRVLYDHDEVLEWADERVRTSTSDPGSRAR